MFPRYTPGEHGGVRKTNKRTIVENDEPTYRKWYYELGFVFVFVFGMHRHRYILYSRTVPTKYMYLKYLRVLIKEFLPLNDFTLSCPLIIGLLAVRRAKAFNLGPSHRVYLPMPMWTNRGQNMQCNALTYAIYSNDMVELYSFWQWYLFILFCSYDSFWFGLVWALSWSVLRVLLCLCVCVSNARLRTDRSIDRHSRTLNKKKTKPHIQWTTCKQLINA